MTRGPYNQSYVFSSSHIWIWELNHKESWVPKNWCFQIVVLEKTLESPLDCKEIQAVNPKGNQPWIFIGRTDAEAKAPVLWPHDVKSRLIRKAPDTGKDWGQEGEEDNRGWDGWMASLPLRHLGCGRNDAEAEAPIHWPPDVKSRLIRKDPDAGKGWRPKEKRMAENEMVRQHYWLNGHEFGQIPEDSERQGSLACCSLWELQRVEHDLATEQQHSGQGTIVRIQKPVSFDMHSNN